MKILKLSLDMPLHPGDISGFRAAIVELVGREHELFHNHLQEEGGDASSLHWGYPLIQYRVHRRRAAIIALGRGVEAVKKQLLPVLPEVLFFAERQHRIGGYALRMEDYHWSLHEEPGVYGILQWFALNAKNYKQWKALSEKGARHDLLSRCLTGHLRSFAEAVGVPAKNEVQGKVLEVHRIKRMKWHGNDFVGFDVLFSSNLSLPANAGLGRSVAFGFGEVLPGQTYKRILAGRRKKEMLEDR